MKNLLLYLVIVWVVFACNSQEKASVNTFFDVKTLIQAQMKDLNARKPKVQKTVTVNQKSESHIIQDIDWSKELELFTQADLNKTAYQQSYSRDTSYAQTLIYVLHTDEHLPIKTLRVAFDKAQKPTKIEATIGSKNYLYESEKHLTLIMTNGKLQAYDIEGFQQLALGKREEFRIVGKVL